MEKILEVDSYRTHNSEGFRLESIGINMGPSHVEFNVPLVYSPISPLSFLRDTVPDILHFQAYANYHINLFLYPVTASIPPCFNQSASDQDGILNSHKYMKHASFRVA